MPNPDGYSSPVDFRVSQNPQPTGLPKVDYNLQEIYDFIKQVILTFVQYLGVGTFDKSLWSQLLPTQTLFAGNLNKLYVIANVNIPIGHYVSLINVAGVLQAKLSNSSPTVAQADGYITSAVTAGDIAEVILGSGLNTVVGSGLTIGQRYWIGNGGNVRTTPDTTAGHMEQYVGIALTANSLWTTLGTPIQH